MIEVHWVLQINLVVSVSKLTVSIFVHTHFSIFYSTTSYSYIIINENNKNVNKGVGIDHCYKSDAYNFVIYKF